MILLHLSRPELFDWTSVEKKTSAIDRLEHAFSKAQHHLGIDRLLDPEGKQHSHTKRHASKNILIMFFLIIDGAGPVNSVSCVNQNLQVGMRPITLTYVTVYRNTSCDGRPPVYGGSCFFILFPSYCYIPYCNPLKSILSTLRSSRISSRERRGFWIQMVLTNVGLKRWQELLRRWTEVRDCHTALLSAVFSFLLLVLSFTFLLPLHFFSYCRFMLEKLAEGTHFFELITSRRWRGDFRFHASF